MKVLQVHNLYALPGGEDTIADAEADLLERAGHEVQRVRVRNPARGPAAMRALAASPWNLAEERAMRARVHRWRPDIAHVHNTWFSLTPAIFHALSGEGVPIVMTLQNYRLLCANAQLFRDGHLCTECVGTHPWRGVLHSCYRGSALASVPAALTIAVGRRRGTWDLVDRFIAPSEFVKSVFVGAGTAPERIVVKPNVVPDPGPRSRPPSESATILYAGRLSPEKGIGLLLDAWDQAGSETAGMELAVVGAGPLREELESRASPRVRCLGWVESAELRERMLDARALVFPSQWPENFGRVIVEALAAGTPVLASDIATPAEIVRELGARWVVKPGDTSAWSSALTALTDDVSVDEAGEQARRLFEAKYSFRVGLRRLLEVYESVLP